MKLSFAGRAAAREEFAAIPAAADRRKQRLPAAPAPPKTIRKPPHPATTNRLAYTSETPDWRGIPRDRPLRKGFF